MGNLLDHAYHADTWQASQKVSWVPGSNIGGGVICDKVLRALMKLAGSLPISYMVKSSIGLDVNT